MAIIPKIPSSNDYAGVSIDRMIKEGFDFWRASNTERKKFAAKMRDMDRAWGIRRRSAFQEQMAEWLPS